MADGTARPYTQGLSDGLGDRLMMFDTATQSSVELLRFKREFSDAPGFEDALRARVEELARFKHPSVASIRGIQTLDDGLALVSNNTAGRRLSEMVHVARGAPFAMDLIQQLGPALAAMHQSGPRLSHGLLTAERIIITREGRLVVVEHVLATAFELLRLTPARLRSELGIAVPSGSDPVGLNQRSDVVQLGFLALSLLLGRRLDPAHFPANISTLLDEFTQADAASAARLRPWLERALQVGSQPFASAQEAHAAFAESAPTAQTSRESASNPAPHSVLAFRPSDGATPKGKDAEGTEADAKSEARKDEPARIELRKEDTPMPSPSPVSSVASPRARKSGGSAVKWIAVAAVVGAVGAGGWFTFTQFSGGPSQPTAPPAPRTATSPAAPPFRPQPTTPATPPPDVPPTAAPLPGSSPSATGTAAAGVTGLSAAGTGGRDTTSTTPAGTAAAKPEPTAEKPTPAPAAGGFGGVKVSAPVELQVFENGNLVGSTAGPIAVLQGSHTFELVNEALAFRVRSTVNVRGGQLTPLTVNLPNGRLSINAVPWADVLIDGKSVGQTPLANLAVVIGQHQIIFRHPQHGEQQQTVTVKAEGLTRVSVTFPK